MNDKELIDMLNADLRDEHASVVRYLIHAYQVGEDTSLGAMLLSMAREEMWHMDWLADEIGEMGAEPDLTLGDYPHDPTSNGSLLRSYIEWEEMLVDAYAAQAEKVDDPTLKRILMQQSKESAIHAKRFAAALKKLGDAAEEPLVYEDTGEFSPEMVRRMQDELTDEYGLMLQHLRHAFVFEEHHPEFGELELTAMRHMKHMSHFAEELAESGHEPGFEPPEVDLSREVAPALASDIAWTQKARERFVDLIQEPELEAHAGLKLAIKEMIAQEEFLAEDLKELKEEMKEAEEKAEPPAAPAAPAEPAAPEPKKGRPDGFTIGSLMDDKN